MDLANFADGIVKTGFKLEFDISSALSAHGWTVINNKYYIDDQHNTVREIDLVAYKARFIQHCQLFTTLIISCKKNEEDIWALVAKDLNPNDPNIDWIPIHVWSNDRAISYQQSRPEWKEKYLSQLRNNGCPSIAEAPIKHIFAFQEMNKKSGKPKNDKNIFASIDSIMKAQAYEIGALPSRKKKPVVYQFNLLSVMDTELLRLDLSKAEIVATAVEDEIYVASYIINKEQTISKIHFITASTFERKLQEYDRLHEVNAQSFESASNEFYADVFKDHEKMRLFLKDISEDLCWPIYLRLQENSRNDFNPNSISLHWDEESQVLVVELIVDEHEIENLNNDKKLRSILNAKFSEFFRYTGISMFGKNDLPF